jgi:putative Ca2+/H+ antiporter (TMEM165/GDT1 family)
MAEFTKALFLVVVAEMGDKTQILAMAFATKFPVKKVLAGIFIGCLLNHGLAVIFGRCISEFIPINIVQIIAGLAFIGFALWSLKSEEEEDECDEGKSKFGAVFTVSIAFFIGELGDKTQLTAITLATDAKNPIVILAGTVLGMVVTGSMGIFVGKKLGDKIPEFAIKIVATSIFMFFGLTKLYKSLPKEYLTTLNITIFIGVILAILSGLIRKTLDRKRQEVKLDKEINDQKLM